MVLTQCVMCPDPIVRGSDRFCAAHDRAYKDAQKGKPRPRARAHESDDPMYRWAAEEDYKERRGGRRHKQLPARVREPSPATLAVRRTLFHDYKPVRDIGAVLARARCPYPECRLEVHWHSNKFCLDHHREALRFNQKKRGKSSARGRFRICRIAALQRGMAFLLDFELFEKLTAKPCAYCGSFSPSTPDADPFVGLDRIDNDKGYLPSNVVPCCKRCNRWKSDMTADAFVEHALKLAEHIRRSLVEPFEAPATASETPSTPKQSPHAPKRGRDRAASKSAASRSR